MAKTYYTIRDLSDDDLHCRALGHQWDDGYHQLGKRPPLWGERHTCICESCSSTRHDTICSDGRIEMSSRHYDYTEDYEFACQFTREECRLERHRRANARAKAGTNVRSIAS